MRRRRITYWLDEDLAVALKAVKDRDGISEAEQMRRALRAWFDLKGIVPTDVLNRKEQN